MKNACIVVKKNNNELCYIDMEKIAGVFIQNGYFFDEIRILSFSENDLIKLLLELESCFDNMLLVTDKSLLPSVSKIFSERSEGEFIRFNQSGMGVYRKNGLSLFLAQDDGGDEVLEFLKTTCLSCLKQKVALRLDKMVLRTIGAPAELVATLLSEAKRLSEDRLAYAHRNKYDEDIIEIFYDETVSRILTDDVLRIFASGLDKYLYAIGDKKLEEQLVDILRLRGKRIAVAESFTGGGVGKRIVSVSGASEVYFEGVNTYNELSKIKRLGVREYSLKSFGAVSDETAYEMAAGLIAQGDVDVSIATTGIAGPKSDRTDFPVGLAYIAVGTKERVHVYQFRFEGNREEITEKAINNALFLAYRQLKDV